MTATKVLVGAAPPPREVLDSLCALTVAEFAEVTRRLAELNERRRMP